MRYFIFLITLFLSSCGVSYYNYSPNQYSSMSGNADIDQLTNLPLYPHQNDIDVFFSDEKPKEEYVKAFLLEEAVRGEISYGALLQRLKEQARNKGVDALIILSRDRITSENQYLETTSNVVNALGIKYVKNLPFRAGIPKQATLFVFDNKNAVYTPREFFKVDKFNRIISSSAEASNLYIHDFYHHSLDYMLHEKNQNWSYVIDFENKTQIYKRRLRVMSLTFTFTYDKKGRVIHVLRRTPSHDIDVEFEYKNGQLFKQKTYRKVIALSNVFTEKSKRIHKRTEVYEYLPNGALSRRTIFKVEDGQLRPEMKLSYEFYNEEEYKELIRFYSK